jgi:hypothetical protein
MDTHLPVRQTQVASLHRDVPLKAKFGRYRAPLSSILLTAALLCGCATPLQSHRLIGDRPEGLSSERELTATPFFPQEDYQCGPAALATVLTVDGIEVSPGELTPQIYLPERQGSLQIELGAAARRYGQVPYPLAPSVEAMLREVEAGHPVLVLQNLGLSWIPLWHYAVVVGYDLDDGLVVLRSGRTKRRVTELTTFERTWRRAEHWALVILPPDRLPRTAEELRYLNAVTALEQTGQWAAANLAYRTALQRWPKSLIARMGIGNSAYALGHPAAAVGSFRAVLALEPNYAPAHNNLAYALLALGDGDGALAHARRAVALGGDNHQEYRSSLREIEDRLRRSR